MMAGEIKRRKSSTHESSADPSLSVPAVCRRPTTDLKDVQDILKSVVNSSEG